MMNSYRVQLALHSGLGTPLAADTLWGHICWGIRYSDGTAALEDWLSRYDDGSPPLVLSDPFPSGYWPIPVTPPAPRSTDAPDRTTADEFKKTARRRWLHDSALRTIQGNVTPESVQRAVVDSPVPPAGQVATVPHAAINRLTSGTVQPDGGSLYTTTTTAFDGTTRFDVWCQSPESTDVVKAWFDTALAGGYGRDASSGLGHLETESITVMDIPRPAEPNAVMVLGPTIPRRTDPTRGLFAPGIRTGRVGGDFAIGDLPDGSQQRQKRPVRVLLAGTVLVTDDPNQTCLGRVIRGVHQWDQIRQYGMCPALPLRISDSVEQACH